MEDLSTFSGRVRWLVEASGRGLAPLSRAAGLGPSLLGHYARGTRDNPERDSVEALSRLFGCKPGWLAFGEGVEPSADFVRTKVAEALALASSTPATEAA